jgi:hypothetical protein
LVIGLIGTNTSTGIALCIFIMQIEHLEVD